MVVNATDLLSRRQVLGPAYRLFYNEPFYPVRAEDVWLYDAQGRRFLDAYNNVPVVGHCNPKVVAAMAEQASVLCTHTRYLHHLILDYAERLLSHFPAGLNQLMLTCTGSEANDLAIRIAEAATGGKGIVVTSNAYHGVSHLLAQLSPSLAPVSAFVRTVAPPCSEQGEGEAARFGNDVRLAFEDLAAHGIQPCAFIIDPIVASDGIDPCAQGSLDLAVQATHAAGALVIIDEVQTGFARLGPSWWGFNHAGVTPDLVTMGKPMGNGYPIAAVVASEALIQAFADKGRYFNTFGGNPVAVAAATAVLDELETRQLPEQVGRLGQLIRQQFGQALSSLGVEAIRGEGLYWGIQMAPDGKETAAARAARVVNDLRDAGVLLNYSGPTMAVLKIRPPLTFNEEHVGILLTSLKKALGT
ncbi:MAG: aminotransferase class III-fold pyridoxal phosphate-dependent enzyme [Neisseriaceae bacterium]|nr:aminotransferase class III-fold pyridoxal phosphate-dependent enzyme [Neisseriaceae bacterium]